MKIKRLEENLLLSLLLEPTTTVNANSILLYNFQKLYCYFFVNSSKNIFLFVFSIYG